MKLSWKQFVLVAFGSTVFGLAMEARDELSGFALRALAGGIGMGILSLTLLLAFRSNERR